MDRVLTCRSSADQSQNVFGNVFSDEINRVLRETDFHRARVTKCQLKSLNEQVGGARSAIIAESPCADICSLLRRKTSVLRVAVP